MNINKTDDSAKKNFVSPYFLVPSLSSIIYMIIIDIHRPNDIIIGNITKKNVIYDVFCYKALFI